MDRIRWINHAGFELQAEGLRIVCDPWLHGLVFSQSWALLSETRFQPSDFRGVDYIWFSHEHPDHFSTASLRSIPPDIRGSITILFQKTQDGRVAKFCRDLGFAAVRELEDWERVDLGRGVAITVKTVDDDSFCLIETPSHRYLNINDCVSVDVRKFHQGIAKRIGSPDVLLTQFSFANWAGNPDEPEAAGKLAYGKIQEIEAQLHAYAPKVLIPCASFVWFCRAENFHLNAASNRISAIYEAFSQAVKCVVLYPGDEYEVGAPHDSTEALRRYAMDEARHTQPLEVDEPPVSREELTALSIGHQKMMSAQNAMWCFFPLRLAGFIKPISVYLTDLNLSLNYSMFGGIRWEPMPRQECDIEFASGAMAQMLRFGTGYDTLYISGRFKENRLGSRFALSKNFVVSRRNERGQFFPGAFFDGDRIRRQFGLFRQKA